MKITFKIIVGLFLAAIIALPAGDILALSYGRGMMGATISTNNSNVIYQSQSVDQQKMQDFMSKLNDGNLNADEQRQMYSLMNAPSLMMGSVSGLPVVDGQQFDFRTMSTPFYHMGGYNSLFVWYSLMCIITIVLVWIVLLLLIVVLYKKIKQK